MNIILPEPSKLGCRGAGEQKETCFFDDQQEAECAWLKQSSSIYIRSSKNFAMAQHSRQKANIEAIKSCFEIQ